MSIDTSQLKKLTAVFRPETTRRILEVAGKRAGVAAESLIPEYPRASGKKLPYFYTRDTVAGKKVTPFKSKFKSAKQAYFVLKLGEKGGIPFRRSGQLGRSIVSAIADLMPQSVTIKIGTAMKYAPLVIGNDDEQSHYHSGTWWQLNKVIAAGMPKIEAETQRILDAEVAKAIKG